MNYRRATLALGLLVAGLAIVVWDLRKASDKPVTASARSDYRLQDFKMYAFDVDGNPAFSLTAPLLERDTDGKSLTIRKPVFVFPGADDKPWQAVSESAWVSDKARELQLREKVLITGPVSPRGLRTEFSTEALSIFPKAHRIHSDGWVTVQHGTSILKGYGLEADMKQRRVQLLSKVEAHYAPK